MKLMYRCTHCDKHVALPYTANTKSELRQARGDAFTVQCVACAQPNALTTSDINAKATSAFLRFGLLLFLMLSLIGLLMASIPWSVIFFSTVALVISLLAFVALVVLPLVLSYKAHTKERRAVEGFNRS
jgi:hypothetical protein